MIAEFFVPVNAQEQQKTKVANPDQETPAVCRNHLHLLIMVTLLLKSTCRPHSPYHQSCLQRCVVPVRTQSFYTLLDSEARSLTPDAGPPPTAEPIFIALGPKLLHYITFYFRINIPDHIITFLHHRIGFELFPRLCNLFCCFNVYHVDIGLHYILAFE